MVFAFFIVAVNIVDKLERPKSDERELQELQKEAYLCLQSAERLFRR